ncbi:hypothetical protein FB446DRAFT_141529 [Lentinula raphanica]|nr:hypothetical protein C8R42DRAFT_688249 [Lentinula raphanica]KAJ3770709.1 hypothetical protein FB446DRAFT_141529 [Lentinula raphanica]
MIFIVALWILTAGLTGNNALILRTPIAFENVPLIRGPTLLASVDHDMKADARQDNPTVHSTSPDRDMWTTQNASLARSQMHSY